MKNDTVYLEATREQNRLKIGIYKPDDVIWHYEELPAAMDRIEANCVSMVEMLNNASRKGAGGVREFEKLKAAGRILCDELLPWNIKEKLRHSDAEYLVLRLDDRLVHIPWELLCVDEDFLCQQFNMGRLVKTRQKIAEGRRRKLAAPLNMWILANPRGDLEVASSEGLKIFQDMARMNHEENIVDPSLDGDITSDEIRARMKNYDIVHFAGHADYSSQEDPGGIKASGWQLADANFTVRDIDRMAGSAAMPSLVFSNACQSARTEPWEWKADPSPNFQPGREDRGGTFAEEGSFGLANAFLRAGVKHYLGTFWEIMDEPGGYFAHEFYDLLSSGMPTGKAVRQARANLIEKYGPDTCWASYILYGDPRASYFGQNQKPEKQVSVEPTISRNTATRGSLFNYSLNPMKLKEMWSWLMACIVVVAVVVGAIAGNYFMKKADFDRKTEIQRILMAQAEKKQEKTEALFKELVKKTAPRPSSETQASVPLTLAMIFDSQISFSNQKKENLAAFAIQSQLIEHSRFKILERKSFDVILQELIWEEPEHLGLLMPKLLLFLEVYDDDDPPLALMRLVDKETGVVIDNLFETLENDRSVFAQKKKLSEKLLKKLEALYPLRGEISETEGDDIRLNIGDDAGVKMGQWFKVIGKEVFLKVVSVEPDTCTAKITKGKIPLEQGWRVEAVSLL